MHCFLELALTEIKNTPSDMENLCKKLSDVLNAAKIYQINPDRDSTPSSGL